MAPNADCSEYVSRSAVMGHGLIIFDDSTLTLLLFAVRTISALLAANHLLQGGVRARRTGVVPQTLQYTLNRQNHGDDRGELREALYPRAHNHYPLMPGVVVVVLTLKNVSISGQYSILGYDVDAFGGHRLTTRNRVRNREEEMNPQNEHVCNSVMVAIYGVDSWELKTFHLRFYGVFCGCCFKCCLQIGICAQA